jgi:hypothetical protein
MARIVIALWTVAVGLLGCAPPAVPPGGTAPKTVTAAPATAPASDSARRGEAAAGTPAFVVTASVADTVAQLREQKTSAFELGLFRLEMLDAPRLTATLLERHVLQPHPQAMGAYTFNATGEVRVRLDDTWQQELAAGQPFIAVRVDFGSFDAPATARASDDVQKRAAEAVAYVRTGLTGSNGCEPWEITANGLSQGKCTYHLIEQRFFPQTKSGYAEPMDPARMHAVANIARAIRIEATAEFRAAGKESKRLTCSGPVTADETRCEIRDAAPK